jgi:hypothetical protein
MMVFRADYFIPLLLTRNPFAQNARRKRSIIFSQALGNVRALFPTAQGIPFPDQADHFPAHYRKFLDHRYYSYCLFL